ncbi:hypothetical protein ACFXG4_33440 [Nocardia sp. NPDC059246]|uniref:hypothetical protein n=1 Tax=unclassified Nocardia TaxID=2637762 RepID=UPI003692C7AF
MHSHARRRVLLSMALTGGLMLLGPSVLGMSGSLPLAASPVASFPPRRIRDYVGTLIPALPAFHEAGTSR